MKNNKEIKKQTPKLSQDKKFLLWSVVAVAVVFLIVSIFGFVQSRQERKIVTAIASPEPTENPLPEELQGAELFGNKEKILFFNADGTFIYNDGYEATATQIELQNGKWSEDKEKNRVTLTFDSGKVSFLQRINQGDLQYIDENGKVIETEEVLVKETNIQDKILIDPDLDDGFSGDIEELGETDE